MLAKTSSKEREGKNRFLDLPNIDTAQLANTIYKTILDIPREYYFVFRLPKSPFLIPKTKILPDTEILSLNKDEIGEYQKKDFASQGLRNLLYNHRRPKFSEGDVVLRIKRKGYVGKYGIIKINFIDPFYILKVILGIFVSLGIIKRDEEYYHLGWPVEYNYFVFEKGNYWVRTISESTDDASFIGRMMFDITAFQLTELDKIMKRTKTKFDTACEVVSRVFGPLSSKDKRYRKIKSKYQHQIRNGSFWTYEAIKTMEDHLRIIYLITAYDSLIAGKGKEKEQKAELIASIISKSPLELELVKESIIKLYDLRNKIVHGEKAIYSFERYTGEVQNKISSSIAVGVYYLIQFLANRASFIAWGLPSTKKQP
jgi:hypothetical protein